MRPGRSNRFLAHPSIVQPISLLTSGALQLFGGVGVQVAAKPISMQSEALSLGQPRLLKVGDWKQVNLQGAVGIPLPCGARLRKGKMTSTYVFFLI